MIKKIYDPTIDRYLHTYPKDPSHGTRSVDFLVIHDVSFENISCLCESLQPYSGQSFCNGSLLWTYV